MFKELTEREKAKAYDKALERAKNFIENGDKGEKTVAESIFAGFIDDESEDERIRKAILAEYKERLELETLAYKNPECNKDMVSFLEKAVDYLERQKEQKSTEIQDYSGLNDLERAIHRGFLPVGVENVPVTIIKETAQDCLSQMKPAEWSEEDVTRRESCMLYLANARDCIAFSPYIGANARESGNKEIQKDIDWLKSLRPQPHWKPSEEQMEALDSAINYLTEHTCTPGNSLLTSLYIDLQKLL